MVFQPFRVATDQSYSPSPLCPRQTEAMNRRELLKCLAAGGVVVAGELWIPGEKTIFLPARERYLDNYAFIQDICGNTLARVDLRMCGVVTARGTQFNFGDEHRSGEMRWFRKGDQLAKFDYPLFVNEGDSLSIHVNLT